MMFPFCQATKNRIQGRVTDRIEMKWVFASPCHFPGHSMTGQRTEIELILPGRFSFVHCEKHSDIFRTRQKNPKRTSAVSSEHYTCNKVFVSPPRHRQRKQPLCPVFDFSLSDKWKTS